MPSLHVLTHRQALEPDRIGDAAVIVLDILFATSSIVSVIAAGADSVIAAADTQCARRVHAGLGADRALLGGEDHGRIPAGFSHFAPLALRRQVQAGQTLVYATTNGTPALVQASAARALYAGALLNTPALAALLQTRHSGSSVLIICAGSLGHMNLEDFYAAGCLASYMLAQPGANWAPTDTARAARGLFRGEQAETCLTQSRVGRTMIECGLREEVEYAAQIGAVDVVPEWRRDRLAAVAPA